MDLGRMLLSLFLALVYTFGSIGVCEGWSSGRATFYGDWDASGTKGGACGYGNVFKAGYGYMTAAASSVIWERGFACGICLQLRCINTKTWKFCLKNSKAITVTVTNMCPQDWRKRIFQGAWCNNPEKHLDLSMHAYLKIAKYKAGVVPIAYRRVPCNKWGGIVIRMQGNPYWMELNVQNVAGPGNILSVWFRPKGKSWIRMIRNWGVVYSRSGRYVGQPLSFMIKSHFTGESVYIPNGVPRGWKNGVTYKTKKQFSVAKMKMALRSRKLVLENPPQDFPKDLPEEFFLETPDSISDEYTPVSNTHGVAPRSDAQELSPHSDLPSPVQSPETNELPDMPENYVHQRFRVGKRFFPSSDELGSWGEETDEIISKDLWD